MPIDIQAFIRDSRDKNMSDNAIKSALLNMGVDQFEINSYFPAVAQQTQPQTVAPQTVKETVMQTVGTFGTESVTLSAGAAVASPVFGNQATAAAAVSPDQLSEEQTRYINKWSWSAFFFAWLYYLVNGLFKKGILYFLGMFVPGLNLFLIIKSGLKGRAMAWQEGSWADFSAFQKRQKMFAKVMFGLVGALAVVSAASAMVGVLSKNKLPEQPVSGVASSTEPSASTSTAAVSAPTVRDCGIAGPNTFLYAISAGQAGSKPTDAEQAALNCADAAVVACSPATFGIGDKTGAVKYEILGANNSACDISFLNNSGDIQVPLTICEVPTNFISTLLPAIAKKNGIGNASVGLTALQAVNIQALGFPMDIPGQKISFNCKASVSAPASNSTSTITNPQVTHSVKFSSDPAAVNNEVTVRAGGTFELSWSAPGADRCEPVGTGLNGYTWASSKVSTPSSAYTINNMQVSYSPTTGKPDVSSFGINCYWGGVAVSAKTITLYVTP